MRRLQLDGGSVLHVELYTDIANPKQIQDACIKESDNEAAFINASLVPDLFILQTAGQWATTNAKHRSLHTRSLHTELVFSLSGSKHIGESLKRYGVNDDCKHLLVAQLDRSPAALTEACEMVNGTQADVKQLSSLTDLAKLTQYHKLSAHEKDHLVKSILFRMAARDC